MKHFKMAFLALMFLLYVVLSGCTGTGGFKLHSDTELEVPHPTQQPQIYALPPEAIQVKPYHEADQKAEVAKGVV